MITTLLLAATVALAGPPLVRPGETGKLSSRVGTSQSAQSGPLSMPVTPLPVDRQEMGKLETRLAVLEAGRNDLSAWATLFVGVVTLLVAATSACRYGKSVALRARKQMQSLRNTTLSSAASLPAASIRL